MAFGLKIWTLQPNSEYTGLSYNLSNQLSNHLAQLFQLLLKTKRAFIALFILHSVYK